MNELLMAVLPKDKKEKLPIRQWRKINTPANFSHNSLATDGKSIYAFGLTTLRKFDIQTQQWTTLTPTGLTIPSKTSSRSVIIDDKMYIIGGANNSLSIEETKSVFIYDLNTNEVTRGANALIKLNSYHNLAVMGREIIAGHTSENPGYLCAYNVDTNSWRHLPRLPELLYWGSLVVADGILFSISGRTSSNTNFKKIYKLVDNAWVLVGELPNAYSATASIMCDGHIYIFSCTLYNPDKAMVIGSKDGLTWDDQALNVIGTRPPRTGSNQLVVVDDVLYMGGADQQSIGFWALEKV